MKPYSNMATLGVAIALFGAVGCRHTSTKETHHHVVTEPAGLMVIKEHPSGKPGIYTVIDPDAKPALTPAPVVRPEVKPTTTPKQIPASIPEKVSVKPLPAENIVTPISGTVSTKPFTASPLFASPTLAKSTTAKPEVVTAPLITAPVIKPSITNTEVKLPPIKPVPSEIIPPPVVESTDFTKGQLPSFNVNAKASHSTDYSWVIGELTFSHTKKTWRLRYASLDSDDQYGGTVTLAGADHLLDQMQNGQLIRVEGELLEKGRSTAPRYRVIAMKPVE